MHLPFTRAAGTKSVPSGMRTFWLKYVTSRLIRDGWQPYSVDSIILPLQLPVTLERIYSGASIGYCTLWQLPYPGSRGKNRMYSYQETDPQKPAQKLTKSDETRFCFFWLRFARRINPFRGCRSAIFEKYEKCLQVFKYFDLIL